MPSIASRSRNRRRHSLRLPAKLRLKDTAVRVKQIDRGLWLKPQAEPEQDMDRWLQAFYAQAEPLPTQFLAERGDAPLQERDWT